MWFRWHKSLWTHRPVPLEVYLRLVYPVIVLFSMSARPRSYWLSLILICRTIWEFMVMIFYSLMCFSSLWKWQPLRIFCKIIIWSCIWFIFFFIFFCLFGFSFIFNEFEVYIVWYVVFSLLYSLWYNMAKINTFFVFLHFKLAWLQFLSRN